MKTIFSFCLPVSRDHENYFFFIWNGHQHPFVALHQIISNLPPCLILFHRELIASLLSTKHHMAPLHCCIRGTWNSNYFRHLGKTHNRQEGGENPRETLGFLLQLNLLEFHHLGRVKIPCPRWRSSWYIWVFLPLRKSQIPNVPHWILEATQILFGCVVLVQTCLLSNQKVFHFLIGAGEREGLQCKLSCHFDQMAQAIQWWLKCLLNLWKAF